MQQTGGWPTFRRVPRQNDQSVEERRQSAGCGPFCMPTFRITAVVPPALACESSCVEGSVSRLNEHDRGCCRAGGLSGRAVPRQHCWCEQAIYREASVAQVQAEQSSDVKGRDGTKGDGLALDPCLHFPHTALQGRETGTGKLYVHRNLTNRPDKWCYFSTSFQRRHLNSSLRVDRILSTRAPTPRLQPKSDSSRAHFLSTPSKPDREPAPWRSIKVMAPLRGSTTCSATTRGTRRP